MLIEITNWTLTTLLRSLVSNGLMDWDTKLPHTEFSYNRAPLCYKTLSLWVCVWGELPYSYWLIASTKWVKGLLWCWAKSQKKLHEQVRNHIEKTDVAYKVRVNKHRKKMEFSLRDLVWLHLRKERFPSRRKNKLMASRDRAININERVGYNAYIKL